MKPRMRILGTVSVLCALATGGGFATDAVVTGVTSALGAVLAGTAHAADLIVKIKDVRSENGRLSVAVYDSEGFFLKHNGHIAAADIPPVLGETGILFENLPPGTYAVAAYHDENASGGFDTNFLGLPLEGFGFSNGAAALFGPPSFEAASVSLQVSGATEVVLRY